MSETAMAVTCPACKAPICHADRACCFCGAEMTTAVMPIVNGRRFRCEVCQANVFTRRGSTYTCNGCGAQYAGR